MPAQSDLGLEEWRECRQTIGRFDGILADTRKYGFTLVTALLTANALVTTSNPIVDRVAGSGVVMVLILVLFLIDRYYWVLLRRSVQRAIQLEPALGVQITSLLSSVARSSQATHMVSAIYALFVLVAVSISLVVVLPRGGMRLTLVALGSAAVVLVLMLAVHIWVTIALNRPLKPVTVNPVTDALDPPILKSAASRRDWTTVLMSAASAAVVVGALALLRESMRRRSRWARARW